ncbi:MAG: type IV pili methyl-accepting chemotaxis transducer N-terminal domain-containing protein [Acidobacteria bacterium]|nr:type IV pili methyl-accepting chemotaxis transducer N-terminal domain-containing protein [Acidobacteriota bacterium]
MSLRNKFFVLIASVLAVNGLVSLVIFRALIEQRSAGAAINVAGAQRMLSQRISRDVLAEAIRGEGEGVGKGLEYAARFEAVQRELRGNFGELGGALTKTDEAFVQFRRLAEQTRGSGAKERLSDFLAQSGRVLAAADSVTKGLELTAKGAVREIELALGVSFLLTVLAAGLGWWQVQAPLLLRLKAGAREMQEGSNVVGIASRELSQASNELANGANQ